MRSVDRLVVLLAVAGPLLLVSGFVALQGGGPGLRIGEPTKSFGVTRVDEPVSARYLLTNRTDVPIRIVGANPP